MRSSGQIVIDAKPEALTINPAQSAVIVVDMQNDFGSEGGMFALAGIDISGIRSAIAPTARVLAAARRAGITVVYLKMGFRPDLSDASRPMPRTGSSIDPCARVRQRPLQMERQVGFSFETRGIRRSYQISRPSSPPISFSTSTDTVDSTRLISITFSGAVLSRPRFSPDVQPVSALSPPSAMRCFETTAVFC